MDPRAGLEVRPLLLINSRYLKVDSCFQGAKTRIEQKRKRGPCSTFP